VLEGRAAGGVAWGPTLDAELTAAVEASAAMGRVPERWEHIASNLLGGRCTAQEARQRWVEVGRALSQQPALAAAAAAGGGGGCGGGGGGASASASGGGRARSHCRFVPPLILCTSDSLRDSAPLLLKRKCDRTLAGGPQWTPARDRALGVLVRRAMAAAGGPPREQVTGSQPAPLSVIHYVRDGL
jgi:hypothetical protein